MWNSFHDAHVYQITTVYTSHIYYNFSFQFSSIKLKKFHMQFPFVTHYISLDPHLWRQLRLGSGMREGEQSTMWKGSQEKVSQKPRWVLVPSPRSSSTSSWAHMASTALNHPCRMPFAWRGWPLLLNRANTGASYTRKLWGRNLENFAEFCWVSSAGKRTVGNPVFWWEPASGDATLWEGHFYIYCKDCGYFIV